MSMSFDGFLCIIAKDLLILFKFSCKYISTPSDIPAKDFCWSPSNQYIIREFFVYQTSCSNNTASSYMRAVKNFTAIANPYMVFNHDFIFHTVIY